jgi:uncharacterized membrane protein YcjF (UPF0283 family)
MDSIVKNIPIPQPSKEIDLLAEREASAIETGNYEQEARKNEHYRRERFQNHLGYAAIILFWLAVFALILMATCWIWHIVAPEQWHFLTAQQISSIQNMLFSATIAKFIPQIAKKYF